MARYVKLNTPPAPRVNELWVVDIEGKRGTMFVLRIFPSASGVTFATVIMTGFGDEYSSPVMIASGKWHASHGVVRLIRRIRLTPRGKDRRIHGDTE